MSSLKKVTKEYIVGKLLLDGQNHLLAYGFLSDSPRKQRFYCHSMRMSFPSKIIYLERGLNSLRCNFVQFAFFYCSNTEA
jgi:hypothetical protein